MKEGSKERKRREKGKETQKFLNSALDWVKHMDVPVVSL
jgi:hypothetical protein